MRKREGKARNIFLLSERKKRRNCGLLGHHVMTKSLHQKAWMVTVVQRHWSCPALHSLTSLPADKVFLFHSQKLPFQDTIDTCKSYCLCLFAVFCSHLHTYIKQYHTAATPILHAIVQILNFFFYFFFHTALYECQDLLMGQTRSISPGNCNFQDKSKRVSKLNPISHYIRKNTSCIIHSHIL